MSTFLTNPYDTSLNLADNNNRKLFIGRYKRLSDKNTFNGLKMGYNSFVTKIGKELNSTNGWRFSKPLPNKILKHIPM